jgi:amidase
VGILEHQLTSLLQTNCLTEICFQDAVSQAKALDEFQKSTGRLIGPLHGVVMSVKDQFNIQGFDSTMGYAGRAFDPAVTDALLIQFLKRLGAIVITKTNLPQSIMVSFLVLQTETSSDLGSGVRQKILFSD